MIDARTRHTAAIALAGAVMAASAAAEADRVLLRQDDAVASVSESYSCEREIAVTIEAGSPDVFDENSTRMQAIADSVQAMLRYECPRVDSVRITGYLRGLPDSVYSAIARSGERWQVTPQRTLRSEDAGQPRAPQSRVEEGEFTLAGVRLGMTVDEATGALGDEFDAAPSYDPGDGVARLNLGGCPADIHGAGAAAQPRTDWTCIEARFTDRRVPRLYRFDYVQVVEGSVQDMRRVLIENFGEPAADEWDAGSRERRMHWQTGGGSGEDGTKASERLRATLIPDGDVVVVDLLLEDGRSAALNDAVDEYRGDVDLRL